MTNENYQIHSIEQESGKPTGEQASVNLGGYDVDLHVPKLEDVDHPQVPEVDGEYIARELNGKTDLEVLSYAINDPDFFAMLEGEAGTGKNLSIEKVLSLANWPRVRVNFSISSSYESLVGRFAPVESTDIEEDTFERAEVIENVGNRLAKTQSKVANPQEVAESAIPDASTFRWVDGLLTKAVKYGWAFVADEINAGEADALMPLNGLTEDRNSRYLTIEEKGEVIEPHERFRFLATRNPVGYAGTADMNSALESRAYIIQYDYHEAEALEEIIKNKTDIENNTDSSSIGSLVNLAQAIRQQEQKGTQYVTKISTRDLIKVGRLTDIMPIREATKTVFLGVADATDKGAIRDEIKATNF